MKCKKRGSRFIYLKLNKKEFDFLSKLCSENDANISPSMAINHFVSLCKRLPLDVKGIKSKNGLKREILRACNKMNIRNEAERKGYGQGHRDKKPAGILL